MEVPVGEVTPVHQMRFDVCYGGDNCTIAPHFCREWDGNKGCFGTNAEHGLSFDDACDEVAEWHEKQARLWRQRKHAACVYYLEDSPWPLID